MGNLPNWVVKVQNNMQFRNLDSRAFLINLRDKVEKSLTVPLYTVPIRGSASKTIQKKKEDKRESALPTRPFSELSQQKAQGGTKKMNNYSKKTTTMKKVQKEKTTSISIA
jgi:hypothetical protein